MNRPMDRQALLAKLDAAQQKHPLLAVPVATVKKFGDDDANSLAATIAFYAFFSVFPLLLVFVTVLGYVLAGDESALHSVKNSVLARFPVIGDQIKNETIKGSAAALAIGIVLTLYAGLGVTGAARNAFDHIWRVPRKERDGWIRTKLRGIILLAVLGTLFVVATVASGLVSGGLTGVTLSVFGVLFSILLNVGLFLVTFKVLCSEDLSWRSLLPGTLLAAVLWEILQLVGGAYIDHISKGRNSTAYGIFAVVLGLLAWLRIGAQILMYSAELNTVLADKLWPKPLFGDESPESLGVSSGGDHS
jgi:membrane protein